MTNDIKTLTMIMKDDPVLVEAIVKYQEKGDVELLRKTVDNLSSHLSRIEVNLFIVTDSRGNIAYQAPSAVGGGNIHWTWGLEEALSGETILSSGYGPQGWAIRSLAPVSKNGKQYGVLILGIYLNDAFARRIAEATHTNISFSTPYNVLASSWPPSERQKMGFPRVTRSIHEKRSFFHIDHQLQLSSFHVPIDIGDETVCLVVNTDTIPIYNLLQEKRKHLLTTFVGVLLLILGIGAALTIIIIRPLRGLQQRALEMVKEISHEEIPVSRWGNEIETLSQAMDLMLTTIRSHLAKLNQTQEILGERENFLASVFASIQDYIAVMDRDFNILRTNPAIEQRFSRGLSLVGQKCYAAFHGRSEVCANCACQQVIETGEAAYQLKEDHSGEETEWVERFAYPLRDLATGQVTGVIEYARVITDRKRAEEALKRARRDWEEIFQAIGQPAFILDKEHKIIAANRVALAALGGQEAEVLGRKCYELFHCGADSPASGCPLEKLLDSGWMETREMEVEALEGTYLVSCTPLFDDQGNLEKVIHIATDITALKRAEEALSKSNRELQETAQRLEQSMNMLHLIMESIPVRVFWKDKDSRYLGCNSLFARDAGLSRPEQLLGQDDFAMGWREQADLYRADDRQVMESGLPKMNIIEPQTTPAGSKIWRNTSKVPLQMPNGEVFGVLGVYEDITARKLSEEALAEEAIRRRVLVEQSRDGIVVLDETGKVYEANQRYAEMLGYSVEEVSQLYNWDWDAQWNREELLEQIRRVDEAGDHFETRHRRKDGTIFDVEISTNGVRLGGQKLIFCVCRDISQRKAAEQALRESEENYRLLVNQVPAVVFRGYADWSIETFDRKIESLTGYPKEDFDTYHLKWIDLILEEDRSRVKDKFITALRNSGTYEREYRIRKKSGEIIWVQVKGRIFLDSAGRIDYISGLIFDVTARKRTEEALLKYEFIANTAQDCMTLIDQNYRYEAANSAYCQAHGKTREEVLGASVAEIWGRDTFERVIKGYLDRCFSGEAVDFEDWFVFGQRGQGCYHVSYNPYFNEDGTVAYAAVVSHDVTESKRMEQEIRKERDLSISIMESLPGIFYLYDEQGRVTHWNKNLEEVSQYSAQEIAEMHPQDFFPDYDKPHIREAVQTCFATGDVRIEADLLSKQGGRLPYVLTGRRIVIEDQPLLVGMGLDISERRQMEEALRKRLIALSRPLDDAADINFEDLFNLDDIQQIQDLFAEVTGVASLITTPDGTPITKPSNFCRLCGEIVRQTEQGAKRCRESDAQMGRLCHDGPNVQHCFSAGLCNAGASITVGGKHIANWMIGQVRDKTVNEAELRSYAREMGVAEDKFITAFYEVPVMSPDKFEQVAQTLYALANQLSTMAYQNVQQARFITERQRAEEALQVSEKRFRDIANNAREWIWETDAQGYYTYSGSMVESLLGYKPEEMINRHFSEPFHPDDREELRQATYEVFASRKPFQEFINRNIHKNGQDVWLSTSGVPILDSKGNLLGYRGADTDITERLQAEKALKESESFLANIFTSIQDGISILDHELNIIMVNPAKERAYAQASPLFGKKCYEVHHGDDKPCDICPALKTLETGKPAQVELKRFLSDREGLRHINLSTFPLIDESSGQVTGVVEITRDITEQKQAEEAVRERESMLSLVINTVPQVIFWKDVNSIYLGCNQNCARAAGLETPGAIVGKAEHDLPWEQEEIEIYLAEDRRVMETRQGQYHQIKTIPLADGRQMWVDATKIPLLAADGTVMGVLGVLNDITERKRMEEELLESEASYRTLAQNLPGLVYRIFVREKFRMEFYNDALQSMTGFTLRDLCADAVCSLDKYILPEDMEKVREAVKEAIALDRAFNVEYRFRKKDGSIRHFAERGKPIPGEDGRVSHIDGVIWDITEGKQLEAAIQESERRFRGLVENVPVGILIVHDGQIVYQNPEQERLFGHLHIKNCHDFVECGHPDDLPKVRQFCQGTLAYQSQGNITMRFIPLGSRPQEKRPVWVNCRATATEYRGQKAMLITMADVTHTKELEQLMRIREKMASLGQVAAGIAHEIRNPLSGINVFLDGIKENFQDPESTAIVQELIKAAQDTSNRIEAVIRRVLDFSRPAELKLAPTDVNLAVDIAIKLTTASLRKDNIKIDSSLATDLPLVIADLQLLEQALLNVITNACEALRSMGKPGEIKVVTQEAKDGVLILVKDSGPGIPPEIRGKIFDPFFTTKAEGSGIGLSLCQRIITDHGGTIDVSSSDLGGTQFIIHLPKE